MDLTKEIATLPLHLRRELEEFLAFLKFKEKQEKVDSNVDDEEANQKWQFGMWKDKIKMTDDFDEPLSDFDEYM
jgi:hypothetical protein